jgi:dihydrofolate reductase
MGGGARVIRPDLHAGLVDDLALSVVPLLLGKGARLFEGIDPGLVPLEPVEALHPPAATPLRFGVRPR